MPIVSRPFGEKGTDLLSGPFHQARINLTIIYLGILVFILFLSSSITYSSFSRQLERRFEGMMPRAARLLADDMPPPPRIEQVRKDLVYSFIMVDGILLVIAGIFAYWFAGITLEPIQYAYLRQRRFLGDASHELRTPLAILQTNLENQQLKLTNDTGQESLLLKSHLEEVERMNQLVNDLLTLSRLDETNTGETKNTVIDADVIIRETVERLQPLATQQQVTLTLLGPEVLFSVQGNKELLQRALSNLIKNAIIYNKSTGIVTIKTERLKQHARVTITDTGIGISAEDLPHLFERFYRSEKSRSRQTGGSGLGLPIVQSILQSMNATISVTSEVNQGTTVTLLFPLSSSR